MTWGSRKEDEDSGNRGKLADGPSPRPAISATAEQIIRPHAGQRGALLPLLHDWQSEFGHIDESAIRAIADALNLSRAEVHGVVSFYHDFRRRPAGRHVVKLCRAESCQARGGDAIEKELVERLGVGMGETRGDGRVTLEAVYCLGLCAIGPNALVDGRPLARIDRATVGRIAEQVAA